MDALHGEFCLLALCAWHHHHLRMSVCVKEPWATYKQLTGHELGIVCASKGLVGSGVHPPPPQGGGSLGNSLRPPPPRVGGTLGGQSVRSVGAWKLWHRSCQRVSIYPLRRIPYSKPLGW